MTLNQTARANWNHADRYDNFGLHLLGMSARRDWIVRHDLSIDLTSNTYAQQRYGADIDRDLVDERIPPELERAEDKLIWLPILRIPSIRAADQRVTAARGSNGQAIPLMPQSQVRDYLSAGLSWLIMNRSTQLRHTSSIDQALIRNGLRRAISSFLSGGKHQEHLGSLLGNDRARHTLDAAWVTSLFDLGNRPRDAYSAGVTESLAYARLAYLAVVGIERADAYPHVQVDLVPADLELTRYRGLQHARQILGLEPPDQDRFRRARSRPWYLPKVLASRATAPSLYHLEIPLPEIADLDGAHVEIITSEEVCIAPAVLMHDQRCPHPTGQGEVAQSRVRGTSVVPSPLETVHTSLSMSDGKLREPANRKLIVAELQGVRTAWQQRTTRLESVERLTKTTPERRLIQRLTGPVGHLPLFRTLMGIALRWRARRPPVPSISWATSISTVDESRPSTVRQSILLEEGIESIINYLEQPRTPTEATERLGHLVGAEKRIPQIEMTADNDLRDHVAHFHVESTDAPFRRVTDSRPVVQGIIRASKQGRRGYTTMSLLACATSTVLLAGLYSIDQTDAAEPNIEAMAALLLLVPGLSVTLVGRVAGDSMRYLVLSRSQWLTALSLVPPVATASIVTVLNSNPSWLLPSAALASLVPTLAMAWTAAAHRGGFNFDAPVLGRLAYRPEEPSPATTSKVRALERGPNWWRRVLRRSGARQRSDARRETTTAIVDSTRVSQVIEPALFQISRPHQRFMVAVTLNQDSPDSFQKALTVLEQLPHHFPTPRLRGRAWEAIREVTAALTGDIDQREADGTDTAGPPAQPGTSSGYGQPVVESSVVASVATTGLTMSIVSHDLNHSTMKHPEELAGILKRKLAGQMDDFHIHCVEIDDDTQYFAYRSLEYRDFTITFLPDQDSQKPLRKARRQQLIASLMKLETDRRRIAYLYCPTLPVSIMAPISQISDEEQGAVRVGFSVADQWDEDEKNLALRLIDDVAEKCGARVSASRVLADRPSIGQSYQWSEARPGWQPFMLLWAGPDGQRSLRRAVDDIGDHNELDLEGGTVVTDEGYVIRALRIWAEDRKKVDALAARLNDAESERDRSGGTGWYVEKSGLVDRAGPDRDRDGEERQEPRWTIAWLRWRISAEDTNGLETILGSIQRWTDRQHHESNWWPTFANIEFLASRVRDGRITGKARLRIGVEVGDAAVLDEVADAVRNSLERSIQGELADILVNSRRYVIVEPNEPANPLTLLPEPLRPGHDPSPMRTGSAIRPPGR